MSNPTQVKIDNEYFPINTSYKVAIECNTIANDESIGDLERALAVIYKLFGDKGINSPEHYEKLLELAQKYLSCGVEVSNEKEEEPDMDFVQDMDYIKASFMSDYGINIDKEELHWWEFFNLLNGLSNSDIGNCCILNRIRNLRNYDLSTISDPKLKNEIEEAQKQVALKPNKKHKTFTKQEQQSINEFYDLMGIDRKE